MPHNLLAHKEYARGQNIPGTRKRAPTVFPYRSTANRCDASPTNPAGLSPLLDSVFPLGVVGAELGLSAVPSLLFPYEEQYNGSVVPQRILEYTAGRLCARRALAEYGVTSYPLYMNSDWRPQWPQHFIGSISHTSGMCGAVVARKSQFRAIGLDMEVVGNVTSDIWPIICSPEEMAWLANRPESQQPRCAALIFSAKESFYKCQYDVTQQWLDFDDVTLNISFNDENSGNFAVLPRKKSELRKYVAMPLLGNFKFRGNLVVTGMAIRRVDRKTARD